MKGRPGTERQPGQGTGWDKGRGEVIAAVDWGYCELRYISIYQYIYILRARVAMAGELLRKAAIRVGRLAVRVVKAGNEG